MLETLSWNKLFLHPNKLVGFMPIMVTWLSNHYRLTTAYLWTKGAWKIKKDSFIPFGIRGKTTLGGYYEEHSNSPWKDSVYFFQSIRLKKYQRPSYFLLDHLFKNTSVCSFMWRRKEKCSNNLRTCTDHPCHPPLLSIKYLPYYIRQLTLCYDSLLTSSLTMDSFPLKRVQLHQLKVWG